MFSSRNQVALWLQLPHQLSHWLRHSVVPNSATLELLGSSGKVNQASVGSVMPYRGSADWEVSQPTNVQVLRARDLRDRGIVSVGHGPG